MTIRHRGGCNGTTPHCRSRNIANNTFSEGRLQEIPRVCRFADRASHPPCKKHCKYHVFMQNAAKRRFWDHTMGGRGGVVAEPRTGIIYIYIYMFFHLYIYIYILLHVFFSKYPGCPKGDQIMIKHKIPAKFFFPTESSRLSNPSCRTVRKSNALMNYEYGQGISVLVLPAARKLQPPFWSQKWHTDKSKRFFSKKTGMLGIYLNVFLWKIYK